MWRVDLCTISWSDGFSECLIRAYRVHHSTRLNVHSISGFIESSACVSKVPPVIVLPAAETQLHVDRHDHSIEDGET
jgi:hypothetical protein